MFGEHFSNGQNRRNRGRFWIASRETWAGGPQAIVRVPPRLKGMLAAMAPNFASARLDFLGSHPKPVRKPAA